MATTTDVRGKLKNGVGFAKKTLYHGPGGHWGGVNCVCLGLDEIFWFLVLFDSCPTQHPCWTVALEDCWQPICLLGPCPRAAGDSWGQMFPTLRQGRSWFFGRPCGFCLCGSLTLSLLQNTLLVFSQSVSPKLQFMRPPIKLFVLCNLNIYYYST